MSDQRQRRALRRTPITAAELADADVLSESTDLDTLLTAILGSHDSGSTIRPAAPTVEKAPEGPQRAEIAVASEPLAISAAAIPRAWLTEAPSESAPEKAAHGTTDRAARSEPSPAADLAALRNRLQRSPGVIPPARSDAPRIRATNRAAAADADPDQRAAPKLLVVVDEQLTGPPEPRGASQAMSREEQRAVGTRQHRVLSLARIAGKDARRLWIVLLGVVVVVSVVVVITSDAISRAFSPAASPPVSGSPSDRRDGAADPAVPSSPATAPAPPPISASDGGRSRGAKPSSSRAAGQPNGRSGPSAQLPGRTAASKKAAPTPTRTETAPRSAAQPAGPEPETSASDLSVTLPLTTVSEPVILPAADDVPAAPRTPEKPQAPPPIAAAASPLSSATATTSRTPPRLIEGSHPEYPSVLRAARVRGIVEVQLTIDETGRVTRAAAVSGPAALREAAERAVRAWRYAPGTVNGVHAPATTTVSFRFEPK